MADFAVMSVTIENLKASFRWMRNTEFQIMRTIDQTIFHAKWTFFNDLFKQYLILIC